MMQTITFPLKLQMKRPEVGDLQDALQLLCINRGRTTSEVQS